MTTRVAVAAICAAVVGFAAGFLVGHASVASLESRVANLEAERTTPRQVPRRAAGLAALNEGLEQVTNNLQKTTTAAEARIGRTSETSTTIPSQDAGAAEPVLVAFCAEKWPTDYEMRAYCQKQQREAVAKLNMPAPANVQAEAFATIREQCAAKWQRDYEMREYCERQQLAGYFETQKQ